MRRRIRRVRRAYPDCDQLAGEWDPFQPNLEFNKDPADIEASCGEDDKGEK